MCSLFHFLVGGPLLNGDHEIYMELHPNLKKLGFFTTDGGGAQCIPVLGGGTISLKLRGGALYLQTLGGGGHCIPVGDSVQHHID